MAFPSNRQLAGIVALLVVLACGGIVATLRHRDNSDGGLVITGTTQPVPAAPAPGAGSAGSPATQTVSTHQSAATPSGPALAAAAAPDPPNILVVHVAGAVKHPEVYRLPLNSRADDAVKAAGGANPNANLDAINLAAKLEDGEQLYVPTRAEQPTGGAPDANVAALPRRSATSTARSAERAPSGRSRGRGAGAHADKLTSPGQGTVNINTASEEELQRLPGIGPAMSARIVAYRKTNGPFSSPEQLMDVGGIGETKFARMQPFVRVH